MLMLQPNIDKWIQSENAIETPMAFGVCYGWETEVGVLLSCNFITNAFFAANISNFSENLMKKKRQIEERTKEKYA